MAEEAGNPEINFDEEEGQGSLKPLSETTPKEKAVLFMTTAAVASSAVAIIIAGGSWIVFVAGILSWATGALMYHQQTQITDVEALKETHEAAKREVDRLEIENDRLKQSVEELTETVGKLEEHEQALDAITGVQGQSVATFTEQVEENKKILEKLKENHKSMALMNIIEVIYRCDADNDGDIEDEELDQLILDIKGINNVVVDEETFRSSIKGSGGGLSAVVDIVKDLLADDDGQEHMSRVTQ